MDPYVKTQPAYGVFSFFKPAFTAIIEELATDPKAAVEQMKDCFAVVAPTLPYLDEPENPMAMSLFSCAASLALYVALRDQGVDAHTVGRAVHDAFSQVPFPMEALTGAMIDAADQSAVNSGSGRFVFDIRGGEGDTAWAMDIRSCGICALFARYDAMDLVPYMCALDDVFSDAAGAGLRRTGTIALGAEYCDFRYEAGGPPLKLVDQFPDRIQLRPPAEAPSVHHGNL